MRPRFYSQKSPVIYTPRKRPPKPIKLSPQIEYKAEHFYQHIVNNDEASAKAWLNENNNAWRAMKEAGLDLARQCEQSTMVSMIENHLKKRAAEEHQRAKESTEKSRVFKRTQCHLDPHHYFSRVTLETHMDGSALLTISYRHDLERPYVEYRLAPFQLSAGQYHAYYWYNYQKQSREEMRRHLQNILSVLYDIKHKDGSRIAQGRLDILLDAMESWFADIDKGLFPGNCISRLSWPSYSHQETKYIGFELFKALAHLNTARLLELLQEGANPNRLFDEMTPLYIAIHFGGSRACHNGTDEEIKEKSDQVLLMISHLLAYGADAMLKTHNETLVEFIARYTTFLNDYQKKLNYKILILLATSKRLRSHLTVHPSLLSEPMGAINTLNEAINKSRMQGPYIKVEIRPDTSDTFTLNLKNNNYISIKTREVNELSDRERHRIFDYFEKQSGPFAFPWQKENYFQWLLNANSKQGTPLIEMITEPDDTMRGILISELIFGGEQDPWQTIYHAKLAMAEIPELKGFMKFLGWMRAFSIYRSAPYGKHITYCEAASGSGFAMTDLMKRYPVHKSGAPDIHRIIDVVYNGAVKPICIDGRLYINDPITFATPKTTGFPLQPTLHNLTKYTYHTFYEHPAHVMPVVFYNDKRNFQAYRDAVMPLVGTTNFYKTLSIFSKQLGGIKAKQTLPASTLRPP